MNIELPEYECPPPYLPPNMVRSAASGFLILDIFKFSFFKRKNNPIYENDINSFMPRLIYIKKTLSNEPVSHRDIYHAVYKF